MAGQVKVEDFEVFSLFRAALLKFAQAADQSLASGDSHISRIHAWVENEQASFWQSQLRKRTEAVTQAKEAVRQKKLYRDSSGRFPGAIEEEKHLARCLKAVEEAQWKIEAVRKALPRLEKGNDLYRGGVAPLGRIVGGEIPRAVALLDRLAGSLEEYVQIEAPAGVAEAGAAGESTPPPEEHEAMSRGEETPVEKARGLQSRGLDGEETEEEDTKPEEPGGENVTSGQ